MTKNCYVFIDASNMFYGTPTDQEWKVDYKKLMKYLKRRYEVKKVFYYSGVQMCGYDLDLPSTSPFPVSSTLKYLEKRVKYSSGLEKERILKSIAKVKFFRKLEEFGYILRLKPIKYIRTNTGIKLKANCDVDLTFDMMRLEQEYDSFILFSGDGDFEILLRYAKERGIPFKVFSRKGKVAHIIKKKYSREYIDIVFIRKLIM
jgi:uncharacterized LabA/DUF88 family protein